MDQWVECGLPAFRKITMPAPTAAGIHRVLDMDLRVRPCPSYWSNDDHHSNLAVFLRGRLSVGDPPRSLLYAGQARLRRRLVGLTNDLWRRSGLVLQAEVGEPAIEDGREKIKIAQFGEIEPEATLKKIQFIH